MSVMAPASTDRYVITRPHPDSGVGSNLCSLAGAIWVARRLGRSVIVDWRDTAVLRDKSVNYFSEFFETPATIQGVRICYAPCVEMPGADEPSPELGISALRQRLTGDDDPGRHFVLRNYHGLDRLEAGTAADQFRALKDFYRFITPRPFVQCEIDRFADDHFRDAVVVGVNVAEGNGMFAKGQTFAERVDTGILAKQGQFLGKLRRAIRQVTRRLPHHLRDGVRIFIATDSLAMRNLLIRLPNAVTRRAVFPPPGAGRFFSDYQGTEYTDRDAVVDQIADMYLLARCQGLVHNFSVFNLYAQTVTTYFNGNVCRFERLYARYWIRALRTVLARRLRALAR